MPTLAAHQLTDFATALLMSAGVEQDAAAQVARSLVGANLRGHDSHGVLRLASYLEQLGKGDLVLGAPLTVLSETATMLVADGQWGLGQIQTRRLMEQVVAKASHEPVVVGTLIHAGHIGRLGEYCEMAAHAGLVSMLMANTHGVARRVAPPGGKAPRLGTNPLAIGVPHPQGALVLDFGTSAVAEGKVRARSIAGQQCPPGWLLDAEGQPTTDPCAAYADPPGTILPLGSDQAYKGFGLALMIEIFAGAASGGVCAREVPINPPGNCVFMLLLNPERLSGSAHFSAQVSDLVDFVRSCPTIDDAREILLPGDPERRMLAERQASGIPIDASHWEELCNLARRRGVSTP